MKNSPFSPTELTDLHQQAKIRSPFTDKRKIPSKKTAHSSSSHYFSNLNFDFTLETVKIEVFSVSTSS